MVKTALALLLLLPMAEAAASDEAPMSEPISYTVRFPDPASHYAELTALVPTGGRDEVELLMAVWTPGSYLVREFARHVESLAARTPEGMPLAAVKRHKNRWAVATGGSDRIEVSYRLYCRELTVRTNFVDADFALLNGAATFLGLAGDLERPVEIELELPASWGESVSALEPLAGRGDHAYRARDFDHLVDSPIYAGNPAIYRLEVDGPPHLLVNGGEDALWQGEKAAADAARVAAAQGRFWGGFPYPRYLVINLVAEGRGGLEHRDSTVLMTHRYATRTREGYLKWLGLFSHELFHAWNGKRLRPVALGPFDYEREVHTRDLWAVEGITSYYDDLLVHRAGLSSSEEYLEALSETLEKLQTNAGRRVQPLDEASFDSWIKFYRRNENSNNAAVSYYTKGAIVAWLLDVEIRRASDGEKSLDDLMRLAFERYAGDSGYSGRELQALAEEVAGSALDELFAHALESTAELDYEPALDWLGLRLTEGKKKKKDREDRDKDDEAGWLGLVTQERRGRLMVTEVPRETPGHAAGINAGDEIVALDGYRIEALEWEELLEAYRPEQEARLTVARRRQLRELPVTFGREPVKRWSLEVDPEAGELASRNRRRWLGGDAEL